LLKKAQAGYRHEGENMPITEKKEQKVRRNTGGTFDDHPLPQIGNLKSKGGGEEITAVGVKGGTLTAICYRMTEGLSQWVVGEGPGSHLVRVARESQRGERKPVKTGLRMPKLPEQGEGIITALEHCHVMKQGLPLGTTSRARGGASFSR